MSTSEIISSVSLFIALFALFLNNKLSSDRDKRKEFKSRLDEIVKSIEDIESLSVKFHCSPTYSEEMGDELRWKLNRLSIRIQSIGYFLNDDISNLYVGLKKSITIKNFGVSSFIQQKISSEIIRDIHSHSTNLMKALFGIYDRKHKL